MGKQTEKTAGNTWTTAALRDEIAWFNTNQKLLQTQHPGMWVAIRHHRIVGVSADMGEAAKQAEHAPNIDGYLLRHVDHEDEIVEML